MILIMIYSRNPVKTNTPDEQRRGYIEIGPTHQ